MKKSFVFLLLIWFISGCMQIDYDERETFLWEALFEGSDSRLLDYSAIKNEDKVLFWREEFDNDDSELFLNITEFYPNCTASIANGKMTVEFFVNDGYMYWEDAPIEIDAEKNFEMEISLIIPRNDSLSYTFAWLPNELEYSKGYVMRYDQWETAEEIDIYYLTNENKLRVISNYYDFNAKNFLDFDEFTILTIRKIENKYAIFINHKFFYIINDKDFILVPSITMNDAVINVFDYFRVYYLP